MNPEEMTAENPALTPEEAQATLAFNTNLMEGMLPEEKASEEQMPDQASVEKLVDKRVEMKFNEFKQDLLSDLEDGQEETKKDNSEA